MEAQMNLTQNPLQVQAEAVQAVNTNEAAVQDEAVVQAVAVVVPHVIIEAEVLKDPELKKAKAIFDELQLDIQRYLIEDYIKPQLDEGDKWISLFNELIESEECMHLEYMCLLDPVTKIINNETALAKMRKLNTEGFDRIYEQHFIEKRNTFTLVSDPYMSMCMEFVMRRWH